MPPATPAAEPLLDRTKIINADHPAEPAAALDGTSPYSGAIGPLGSQTVGSAELVEYDRLQARPPTRVTELRPLYV